MFTIEDLLSLPGSFCNEELDSHLHGRLLLEEKSHGKGNKGKAQNPVNSDGKMWLGL